MLVLRIEQDEDEDNNVAAKKRSGQHDNSPPQSPFGFVTNIRDAKDSPADGVKQYHATSRGPEVLPILDRIITSSVDLFDYAPSLRTSRGETCQRVYNDSEDHEKSR